MKILVADGNRRPHDPVQAAKFALEAGIIVRKEVPILPHWKNYKWKNPGVVYYDTFVTQALFSSENFLVFGIVAFSFLFNKHCLIMK